MTVRSVAILLVLAGGLLPTGARAQEQSYISEAFDLETGKLLFREENIDRWKDGKLLSSETTCLAGQKVLLHRTVNYRTGRLTPSSRIDNLITGDQRAVEVTKKGIALLRKEDGEIERATVQPPPEVITPGALPLAITDRWERVVAGHPIDFKMPVAIRLEWYSLRMQKVRFEKVDGRRLMVVALTPQNAALKLIAPTTEFYFDPEKRLLVEYRGEVSVTNKEGERIEARVVFRQRPRFQPPGEK